MEKKTIPISAEVHQRLKKHSLKSGLKIYRMIEIAILRYLAMEGEDEEA